MRLDETAPELLAPMLVMAQAISVLQTASGQLLSVGTTPTALHEIGPSEHSCPLDLVRWEECSPGLKHRTEAC